MIVLKKIDHVGIAVHSLPEVKAVFKSVFSLEPDYEETVAEQKVNVAGFKIGETHLEFLEPTQPDSPIAKFLEKRGQGIHHIAVDVDDINHTLQQIKQQGLRLIDEQPRTGAGGKLIAFTHPKSLFGILLEITQKPPE